MSYRNYANSNGFIVAQNGTGDFTSINAAITAINSASPALTRPIIFLTDITYNESFILPSGCLLTSLPGSGLRGAPNLTGTITYNGGTTTTISDLRFNNTTGGYSLSATNGSFRIQNCSFVGTTSDLFQTIGTGGIGFNGGTLNFTEGNFSIGSFSGTGGVTFNNFNFNNGIGSTKSAIVSNGNCTINNSSGIAIFSSSNTGNINIYNSEIDNSVINTTVLTSGGQGDNVSSSFLASGTATAINITSNCTITTTTIKSSNINAISGTGTLIYSDITFNGTSSTIQNSITQSLLITNIGKLTLGNASLLGSLIYVGSTNGNFIPLTPSTNGDVLQLKNGIPAWSTPTFPISVGASGTILRSDGTNWLATTATYPATTTINQILYSSSANTIAGLATANNAVVNTNGSGVPSLTATPTVTSITFGSGTALSVYQEGTWTPTIDGAVSGTTTYTVQQGYYTKIGNMVFCYFCLAISGATGTGNAIINGLPFTIKNQTQGFPQGACSLSSSTWTWPASTTSISLQGQINTTTCLVNGIGSGVTSSAIQMSNSSVTIRGNIFYQV